MGCLLIKEAMFANCILFATFCSMGTLVRRRKIWRYSARKVMAFGLLMADIPVYVSCKFEMYIFKIALVISENVCIAFLFVLSICIKFCQCKDSVFDSKNKTLCCASASAVCRNRIKGTKSLGINHKANCNRCG